MGLMFCLNHTHDTHNLTDDTVLHIFCTGKVLTLSKHCKGSEGLFEQRTTAGWQRDKRTTLGVDAPWWL